MNKRVHEIAKERGLPTKQVLERLQAAGIDVKASSSSVDEAAALRVLGNGDGSSGRGDATPRADRPPKQGSPARRTAAPGPAASSGGRTGASAQGGAGSPAPRLRR